MSQLLPLEELYAPPINIYVRDNRQFGRKPIVGVHAVKSLQAYRRQPPATVTEMDSDKPATTGQLYSCSDVCISLQYCLLLALDRSSDPGMLFTDLRMLNGFV